MSLKCIKGVKMALELKVILCKDLGKSKEALLTLRRIL